MYGRCLCLALALAMLLPVRPAGAQAAQPRSSDPAVRADIDKLPVSLARIRRDLERAPDYEERFEDFRLLTIQNVYGLGPAFELFPSDGEVAMRGPRPGAPRYGSVTHSEFLAQVAPRNFQAPLMNLSGGLMALTNWAAEKRREAKRRQESDRKSEVGSRK